MQLSNDRMGYFSLADWAQIGWLADVLSHTRCALHITSVIYTMSHTKAMPKFVGNGAGEAREPDTRR
jgi:hypothetical protein